MPRTPSAELRPYTGAPALRIDRTILAVEHGLDGRYYVRNLCGGALVLDGDVGDELLKFAVLADAVDWARGTGSLVWHDFPSLEAAIEAGRMGSSDGVGR